MKAIILMIMVTLFMKKAMRVGAKTMRRLILIFTTTILTIDMATARIWALDILTFTARFHMDTVAIITVMAMEVILTATATAMEDIHMATGTMAIILTMAIIMVMVITIMAIIIITMATTIIRITMAAEMRLMLLEDAAV